MIRISRNRVRQLSHQLFTRTIRPAALSVTVIFSAVLLGLWPDPSGAAESGLAVGSQFTTTHVYVAPETFDRFVASIIATFGGTTTGQVTTTVTPTPSSTLSQLATTPVGLVSAFGFKTPIPYPFGVERTGCLVTDIDRAVAAARAAGADVVVAPFADPIGRDAIIQWPGGVDMQLYWHVKPSSHPALQTLPENRVYLSPDRVDAFVTAFLAFSKGTIVSDVSNAPGKEIGLPGTTHRRVRIESGFGRITAFVTDGHLPYPFGHETTGYEVADLDETLARAAKAGSKILIPPSRLQDRTMALVQFPGGYIAEIHAAQP